MTDMDMAARLEQLEGKARLWPFLTAVVAVVAFLVGALAMPTLTTQPAVAAAAPAAGPSTVRARGFELVDDAGRVRATLGFEADGGTALIMLGEDGTGRLWLSASPDGTSRLNLADLEGRRRLELETRDSGAPSLKLFDPLMVPRIMLSMEKSGGPSLMIHDPAKNRAWFAPPR